VEGGVFKEYTGEVREYLKSENPSDTYDMLMGGIWNPYRVLVDRSRLLNRADLLLDEARVRFNAGKHSGRIMTDLFKKLPSRIREVLIRHREGKAADLPQETVREIARFTSELPDWMREYLEQMSFRISEPAAGSSGGSGLTEEEFGAYRRMLGKVLPHVEHLKRRFGDLLPSEEDLWGGAYPAGKRLNTLKLAREIPTGMGRIYKRKEGLLRRKLAFELLLDMSSSMKREEKMENALQALIYAVPRKGFQRQSLYR